jgi:hypothetical protein
VLITPKLIFGLLKVCYECSSFAKKILLLVNLKSKNFRATWTYLYCDFLGTWPSEYLTAWSLERALFVTSRELVVVSEGARFYVNFSQGAWFQYNKTLHGTLTYRTMEISTLKNPCCTNKSLKKSVLACSKILILEVYSLPGSLLNNNKYRIKLQRNYKIGLVLIVSV